MDIFNTVGSTALDCGTPRHPWRDRAVGTGIGHDADLHGLDFPILGKPHLVSHPVGMPLITFAHGPLPIIGHLDLLAGETGCQGGAGTHQRGRVVLPAKSPSHGDCLYFHIAERHTENGGGKTPGAERMLHAAVNLHDAVSTRNAQCGLRFHISMLGMLRAKFLL